MSSSDTHTLMELSRRLLDAIDKRDWSQYEELCEPTLTAFEPEAVGHLVEGLDFHAHYFHSTSSQNTRTSTISSPQVRLLGDVAVVTYVRLVQLTDDTGASTAAMEETRVWQRQGDTWQHVHFHRSPAGHIRL